MKNFYTTGMTSCEWKVFSMCDRYRTQKWNNIQVSDLTLKTLFNIVEERLKKLLNFDVSAV